MKITQFEDKALAQFAYAIVSNGEMVLIDPARDPQPYYDHAKKHYAKITAVIETHPHADFVSSHLEIHQTTGATIYISKLVGAEYPHQTFDEGDVMTPGNITLKPLNTPGHSPDSISIVALDEKGREKAVFTGDTLFVGDCGRPDLREEAGAITADRTRLASQMYHTLRTKLMALPDNVTVYPGHGSGSLCGKGLSTQNTSTIGAEKAGNWSLQEMEENDFINALLEDQPYVPKYFPFDVAVNKKGAVPFAASVAKVDKKDPSNCDGCTSSLDPEALIIDTRPQEQFKKAHPEKAINLMNDLKFETWLGSIVNPGEPFYLVAGNETELDQLIARTAKIGYENQIARAFSAGFGNTSAALFHSHQLPGHEEDFTILDVRNDQEVNTQRIFSGALHIPLHKLRERIDEIPTDKPVVVHCAGGYRSAAGSSIVEAKLKGKTPVYDLGEAIKDFSEPVSH